MAKDADILDTATRLSQQRREPTHPHVIALSARAIERAHWLRLDGQRSALALAAVARALGQPCFASYDEHARSLLEVATAKSAAWPGRDAAVDTLIEAHSMWPSAQALILAAIDDEETPWGYRLVLTGCCGAEGARRLEAMLPRTKFEETRLRAKVQQTILRLADQVDVTSLLDTLYDGLRWDARASMIRDLPPRDSLIGWVRAHIASDVELDVRRAALGWLAQAWRGDPPELEPELASALLDAAFPDDLGERVAQSLAVRGTRASLEGLVAAATERQGSVRYAARLAIQQIEARLPVDQRVSGGLSISLEPELDGALTQAQGARQGDLSMETGGSSSSALVHVPADAGALDRSSRNDRMLARWTQIAPAPRKTPLALRAAVGIWNGSWALPFLWFGLGALNSLVIAMTLGGAGHAAIQFFASFWMYYTGALVLCTSTLFFSRRKKTLKNGNAQIASLVQRDSKGSRWRVESTTGNSEFTVKGRQALNDTLPVLLDSGRGKITSRELSKFAEIDPRGNLVFARNLYSLILGLPLFTYGSLIVMIAAAILSA